MFKLLFITILILVTYGQTEEGEEGEGEVVELDSDAVVKPELLVDCLDEDGELIEDCEIVYAEPEPVEEE